MSTASNYSFSLDMDNERRGNRLIQISVFLKQYRIYYFNSTVYIGDKIGLQANWNEKISFFIFFFFFELRSSTRLYTRVPTQLPFRDGV